jgi:rare lipoprotein A
MSPCGVTHPQTNVIVAAAVVSLLLSTPPVRSEPVDAADGVAFDDRFLIDGQVAPTFTRPEVLELFATLTPSERVDDAITSAEANRDTTPRTLGQMIFAEPKGPVKVLKDLLNTPVKELLVSRAEAGADVPSPVDGSVPPERPLLTDSSLDPAVVPTRRANPVSERPPAEIAAALPGAGASQVFEPVPAQDSGPLENPAPQQLVSERPAEVSAAPAPSEPPEVLTETRGTRVDQIAAAPQPAAPTDSAAPDVRNTSAQAPVASATEPEGGEIAKGPATWYEHPGRTASGEKFDPDQLTAAHHTLPFGTRVRVLNEETGRTVVVRINDRIPTRTKILIDLSRGSAKAIGLSGRGWVSLHELSALPDPDS